jgi:hypothetical protein
MMAMKEVAYQTDVKHGQPLLIPPDVVRQLPEGRVDVYLRVADSMDSKGWQALGSERFFHDDSPDDALYNRYDEHIGRRRRTG